MDDVTKNDTALRTRARKLGHIVKGKDLGSAKASYELMEAKTILDGATFDQVWAYLDSVEKNPPKKNQTAKELLQQLVELVEQ